MSRRPSEMITSLRARSEEARLHGRPIIKGGRNARFCPAGHCFQRVPLSLRQRHIQAEEEIPYHILPPITCNGCSREIGEPIIAGCCKSCDLDFCEDCFESGIPIDDLLHHEMDREIEMDPTVSLSAMSEVSMSVTEERCSLGHSLCRVLTARRKRYLQERDGLSEAPVIECDCCSGVIMTESIAGCCIICDIDFCEACFQSGQSFVDTLDNIELVEDDGPSSSYSRRYNGQRPTYKKTGRVSYDDYPDPTVFQWAFTGSSEAEGVEFFEKDYGTRLGVIKLDFYYARGKIRTILDHQKKGVRPLFDKDNKISSKLYRKILQDPRRYAMKSLKTQTQVV